MSFCRSAMPDHQAVKRREKKRSRITPPGRSSRSLFASRRVGHAMSYPAARRVVRGNSPVLRSATANFRSRRSALVAFLHQRRMTRDRVALTEISRDARRQKAADARRRDRARQHDERKNDGARALHAKRRARFQGGCSTDARSAAQARRWSTCDSSFPAISHGTPLDTHTPGGMILATQIRTLENGARGRGSCPKWVVLFRSSILLAAGEARGSRDATQRRFSGAPQLRRALSARDLDASQLDDLFFVVPPVADCSGSVAQAICDRSGSRRTIA